MNIPFENLNKRIINPVWSSDQRYDITTSANVWPVRPQSYLRRFHNTPKTRRSYVSVSQFSPQITPITMRFDIEQYNKNKSQSSMAFCSTSKVKYMPLHKVTPDEIASTPGIFPILSRPNSRPVIIHGQRYTIMAVEEDKSSTSRLSSNTKEEEKLSTKTDYISEQRRRFHNAERNKSSTKLYRGNTESSEYRIRRNYFLNGHSIYIKSLRESTEERHRRPPPILNIQSAISQKENHSMANNITIVSAERTEIEPIVVRQEDPRDTKTPSSPVISVEIVPTTKDGTDHNNVTDGLREIIQSVVRHLGNALPSDDSFDRARGVLTEMITRHYTMDSLHHSDEVTLEDSWQLLQPKMEETGLEDAEVHGETEVKAHNAERHPAYWAMILALLKMREVDESLRVAMKRLVTVFSTERPGEESSVGDDEAAFTRIFFWLQMCAESLEVQDNAEVGVARYATVLATFVVNRNTIDDDTRQSLEDCLHHFLRNASTAALGMNGLSDVSTTKIPLSQLPWAISWIIRTHDTLFHHPLALDDVITAIATLTNHRPM